MLVCLFLNGDPGWDWRVGQLGGRGSNILREKNNPLHDDLYSILLLIKTKRNVCLVTHHLPIGSIK